MAFEKIRKIKKTLWYGVSLAILLLFLKGLEWQTVIVHRAFEVYAGAIAIFFTALGVWLAAKLVKPKLNTVVIEKRGLVASGFTVNHAELNELKITSRELEVLQLMSDGLSNQEIADRLFVSLNTVKTHSSNLFQKMDVGRRTQAVDRAKRLGIIP